MERDKGWEIQPVCKTCQYRRQLDNGSFTKRWNFTVCHYFLDTGEMRDGKPEGNYCPNYKARKGKRNG